MRLSTLRGTLHNRTFTLFTGKSTTKNKRTKKGGLRTGIGYSTLIQLESLPREHKVRLLKDLHKSGYDTKAFLRNIQRFRVERYFLFSLMSLFFLYTRYAKMLVCVYLSRIIKSLNSITRPNDCNVARYQSNCTYYSLIRISRQKSSMIYHGSPWIFSSASASNKSNIHMLRYRYFYTNYSPAEKSSRNYRKRSNKTEQQKS